MDGSDSSSKSGRNIKLAVGFGIAIFAAFCAFAFLQWWRCCRKRNDRNRRERTPTGWEFVAEEGQACRSTRPGSSTVWTTTSETAFTHGIRAHPCATLTQPQYLVIRQPRKPQTVLRPAGASPGKYLRRTLSRKRSSSNTSIPQNGSGCDWPTNGNEINTNFPSSSRIFAEGKAESLYKFPTSEKVVGRANYTRQRSPRVAKRATKNAPRFTPKLFSLTIATDATPDNVGGYCIDFAAQSCEYYSFPTSILPQCLTVKRHFNSAEFEMNNLAFALLYWEPLILDRKRLHLYTDNNAVREKGIRPEHGEKVRAHLDHLEKCEGVKLLNRRRHHVNRKTRAADFKKYIAPADDLSRESIEAFKEKIQGSFPKITEFFEIKPVQEVTNEVQERWNKHSREPCRCELASFTKESNDERAKRPLVKAGRNNRGITKVPKVKRLNRK